MASIKSANDLVSYYMYKINVYMHIILLMSNLYVYTFGTCTVQRASPKHTHYATY